MLNLLHCPFCGSKDLRTSKLPKISQDLSSFEMISAYVSCNDCGADGPKIAYVNDVYLAWNQRKESVTN